MKTFTIEQARSAISAGGVLSANLKPNGSMFTLEFETHNGPAMLIAAVSKQVRRFGNPATAFEIVRDLGLEGGHFSVAQWRPEDRALDRPVRPDKSATLKAAHEAAGLKRMLEQRIVLADAPDAIWHDAEDVFAALEAHNAR
jgi:hypothetical protein